MRMGAIMNDCVTDSLAEPRPEIFLQRYDISHIGKIRPLQLGIPGPPSLTLRWGRYQPVEDESRDPQR